MTERFIHCQYCDDVRAEVNEKLSLIGVYNGGLQISGPLPASIPEIWLVCHIGTPLEEPIQTAVLRVLHDGVELLTTELPRSELSAQTEGLEVSPTRRGFLMTIAVALPPFTVERSGSIAVEMDLNGTRMDGNRLAIKVSDEQRVARTTES